MQPGEYLVWAQRNGYDVTITKCWEYEPVPESADADMLVVLGGWQHRLSMNPGWRTGEPDVKHWNLQVKILLMPTSKTARSGKSDERRKHFYEAYTRKNLGNPVGEPWLYFYYELFADPDFRGTIRYMVFGANYL